MNDKLQVIAEFDKCPGMKDGKPCGSTRRFAGEVAEEQREKGLMGKGLKVGIFQMSGPIADPRKVNQMLVGTKVPIISALLDICMECGTLYAVRLERGDAPLSAIMAQPRGQPPFMPPMAR